MKTLLLFLVCIVSLSAKGYTDLDVVAATLIAEAGGEKDPRAMKAVYEVIVKRAKDRKLSEVKVCLQPKQFSCWNDVNVEKTVKRLSAHRRFAEAKRIVQSPVTSYTFGADHYHTTAVKPKWAAKLRKTVQIQNHIFYREK